MLDIGKNRLKCSEVMKDFMADNVIDERYPNVITTTKLSQQAILGARNDEVKIINNRSLSKMPGDLVECISVDSTNSLDGDDAENENLALQYPLEYLASLKLYGLPPAVLSLKIGCIIMLLRNLCVTDGLCNGTRLIV